MAEDWLAEFQNIVREGGAKASTLERYDEILRHVVLPHFGNKEIANIRRPGVLKFLRGLKNQGKGTSTIEISMTVMGNIFQHALDMEIIEQTPMVQIGKSLRLNHSKGKDRFDVFTANEVEHILSTCQDYRPDWHAFFLTAFRTGLRLGELLALEWNDIDLDTGKAIVSKSFRAGVLGTPKNGKQRTVDLSPQVVDVLKKKRRQNRLFAIKEGRKPFVVVFCKKNGDHTSQNTTRGVWRALLKKSGLPYRKFHSIRHTVASLMVAAGVPVTDIQATLGHHSAAFTLDVYGQSVRKETAKTAVLDSISNG